MAGKVVDTREYVSVLRETCRRRKGGFHADRREQYVAIPLSQPGLYLFHQTGQRAAQRRYGFLSEGRRTVCDAPHIQKKGRRLLYGGRRAGSG